MGALQSITRLQDHFEMYERTPAASANPQTLDLFKMVLNVLMDLEEAVSSEAQSYLPPAVKVTTLGNDSEPDSKEP